MPKNIQSSTILYLIYFEVHSLTPCVCVYDLQVEFVRQQQQNFRQKREQDADIAERAAERELAREVVIDFESTNHLNDPQRDDEWYLDSSMEKVTQSVRLLDFKKN